MAEPHQFNEAGTFCLLQNCSPLTADVFFSHPKKGEKKKKQAKPKNKLQEQRHFFSFKNPVQERKCSKMFKDIKTLGVTMCCTVIRLKLWKCTNKKSKSMSFIVPMHRNGCSNKSGRLRQCSRQITPFFSWCRIFLPNSRTLESFFQNNSTK